MTSPHLDPARRQDFKLIFDVTDGNPNGDPDSGNLPRVDPETMQGLVTDVCVKRKVRDFVTAVSENAAPNRIYVQHRGAALSTLQGEAYSELKIKSTGTKQAREDVDGTRQWMCDQFWDIRTFGAVMSIKPNCGQVRGPVQLTFARSIDPITTLEIPITRVAITREEDAAFGPGAEEGETVGGGKVTEMGRKAIVPYGLYVAVGSVAPFLARQTGFHHEDLDLLWQALAGCWDMDRSAARGIMSCRGLHVWSHDSTRGNAPAWQLLERVAVTRRAGVKVPRNFGDYEVQVNRKLPEGVTFTSIVS